MTAFLRSYPLGLRMLATFAVAFLFSGCESDQPSRPSGAEGRRHLTPPPPLAGKETFFDGRITAELLTGAGFGDAGSADETKPAGGSQRGGGGGGGMHMGGGMGGGGGGRHSGGGGGRSADSGPSVSDTIEQDQIMNIRSAAANAGPPVIIHLRFTNQGSTHVDLLITDFLSELGNFVVQPEKLSLDAGQAAEVEPMTSRLAGEIVQADITLTLRLEGHSEKKVITLIQVPAPPPPVSPPAAGPPEAPAAPPKN